MKLSSDSAEDSIDLRTALATDEVVDAIASNLNELIPEVSGVEITPDYTIEVEIELIVDTTNTPSSTNSTEAFINVIEELGFGVEINNTFITSLPTFVPSLLPTIAPTTLRPTMQPSITGLVVVVEVSMEVETQLTPEEEENLTNSILNNYNVSEEEVEIEIDYTTSGTITIADIPEDASIEEIEEAVIDSLSETLGVHPKDIEIISIDPISGEVEFEIKEIPMKKQKKFKNPFKIALLVMI